jgi:hypothetical protein
MLLVLSVTMYSLRGNAPDFIWEVPGSILGQYTDYFDRDFYWFSSVPQANSG